MKFRAFDSEKNCDCVTEIKNADKSTVDAFVQTWVPSYAMRTIRDLSLPYALFPWDMKIRLSFFVGAGHRCYAACTGSRLDGLLCLSVNHELKVELLATAPWNYGKHGRIRRVGGGLLVFAAKNSIYAGRDGRFKLYALKDAEPFYERIGMKATGNTTEEGLKEYIMTNDSAHLFIREFEEYLIEE